MNEREIIEQLEGLIEAWQLNEADLNQTDINAIKQMLDKNKKLKQQLEKERKARKKAMELKHKFHKDFGLLIFENYELIKFMNKLEDILDIDKGE